MSAAAAELHGSAAATGIRPEKVRITNMATNKTDVYQIVTDRILAELDKGVIPWKKPWIAPNVSSRRACAYSRATGKPYSLLNQMLLGKPGEWASFKQIQEAGGRVKAGEKSSVCVFWKFLEKDVIDPKTGKPALDDHGHKLVESIPMLRYYNVFHIESQCEGIQPRKHKDDDAQPLPADQEWEDVEKADAIVQAYLAGSGVKLTETPCSDRAFYSPATDSVTVPSRAQFPEQAEFYSTLFHELTHSTGHKSRLDRFSGPGDHTFGGQEYSKEELVAEIGAACLNSICGIESAGSFKNSASYIAGWAKKLREDRKMIVSASSRAEKAVNLILAGGVMA